MGFVLTFEQQGDLQDVRDEKAAAARNAIRRDPGMLTGDRTLDDVDILRNVVCFSRDAQNNLLFPAGPVRSSTPAPRSIHAHRLISIVRP
jgi:hypothetical protein